VDKKVLKDEAIRWTEQYLVKQFRWGSRVGRDESPSHPSLQELAVNHRARRLIICSGS
jgi:hypothetical protein